MKIHKIQIHYVAPELTAVISSVVSLHTKNKLSTKIQFSP